jgi:glycogen debranching enzyme
VKSGQFNRRDWCDNVFRTGYVTYDEALYARALYCLSGIFSKLSDPRSAPYRQKYEKVKKSINDILWSEEKGYFVNYKNGGFVEDNLSIDTVLIALFNLSEPERIRRMLKNMEDILESKNNTEQTAGDFGVLCVYPFYRDAEAVVQKSSQPYRYHNGADWPYLSAAYAYAKMKYSMDFEYPLTRWFDYNIQKGNLTPIEFFAPFHAGGSLMQAWSAMSALLYNHPKGDFFDVGVNQDSGIKSIYD